MSGLVAQAARAQAAGPLRTYQTRAGTPIANTAGLRFDIDGATRTGVSNTDTIIVAEQLDVALVRDGQGVVTLGQAPVGIALTLTNNDNGEEAFTVTGTTGPDGIATLVGIARDVDGDGRYDPRVDTLLADGRTPVLQPGESVRLFAILTSATGGASGTIEVTARAATGSGATGTSYPGRGDGGGDAVVGPSGASATLAVPIRTAGTAPSLTKSQSVRNADGSVGTGTARRDAVITYTLLARFPDALPSARIDDPIPAGTAYVPGSLRLDGAALTDAADADPGGVDGRTVTVALAGIAAGSGHTVEFQVKIQ